VLLVVFGTRGDVQPFCVLGQSLSARGHDVCIVTTRAYAALVRRFGLTPIIVGDEVEKIIHENESDDLFTRYFAFGFGHLHKLHKLAKRYQQQVGTLVASVARAMRDDDVVVYNPFAFFAGILARQAGLPAVAVMCQPLVPTGRESLSLLGGRNFGSVLNRASHELPRLLTPLLWKGLRDLRRPRGGEGLRLLANPLTQGLRASHPVLAYSAALSPGGGVPALAARQTGFWFRPAEAGAQLPPGLTQFLEDGPAPVYIGFGSMLWGAERKAELVVRTLQHWGGRAIVSAGAGTFARFSAAARVLPPEQVHVVADADHALLLPRVAAIVHHGGAGTTAAALRAGRPSVVLPILGDQLYWGRRVAALGAGEEPLPLGRVTPTEFAARIGRALGEPGSRYAAAAGALAAAMAREPGVAAAADLIERLATGRPA
jgi:sterol 3beta-glucosyltransferase